ncbi:Dipeptidylaminopeptidase/acylaminoacyl-peptidase-like protein [Saccharothrix espanaensis DSM 44229]|uniref:Dipeptidylaminopeptidase/acylaminoacyl-peptidase-like protein n=1 Tax=Saccharothrix espanaensis (strain ATCC 51144 / DSM 44229 / JCM 9112 / NBRC 15066 / NRRL 15764) TaxID=1179773 RepID=K0K561_SACES|nr:Dipeptidylaminopeptidase/acylaminoacyl-peptidase-like protein [Saccharothrix espanaensis DSM 44229]
MHTTKDPGQLDSVTVVPPNVTPVTSVSHDAVTLHGLHLTSSPSVTDLAFVVGHGFTNHVRKPFVLRVLERFARHGGVVALDFRGHGRSHGLSTVGNDEVHDLAAGVSLARDLGYRRVVTVGFSMGASIALRHAALHDERPAAVAAVSTPSRWWVRDTVAMRRVHWLLEQPHGRLAARALGVRLGPPWRITPPSPLEVVHRIAPTPLLIVHGEEDHYFGPAHARALHRAAGGGGELWLEPRIRHAESAMTPALVDRIATWLDHRSTDEGSR